MLYMIGLNYLVLTHAQLVCVYTHDANVLHISQLAITWALMICLECS